MTVGEVSETPPPKRTDKAASWAENDIKKSHRHWGLPRPMIGHIH